MLGTLRYERAAGPGPTQNASSATLTCNASRSASEKIATVGRPISCAARLTRTAISPRLAMSSFFTASALDLEQGLSEFDGLAVAYQHAHDVSGAARGDRVADAERLDVRELAALAQRGALTQCGPREAHDADDVGAQQDGLDAAARDAVAAMRF